MNLTVMSVRQDVIVCSLHRSERVCGLLSDTDADTVLVVLCKRLYEVTLRIGRDAGSVDTVLVLQQVSDGLSTLSGQVVVDGDITCTLISITGNLNLCIGILLQVVSNLLHLVVLGTYDLSSTDGEEDVATERLSAGLSSCCGGTSGLLSLCLLIDIDSIHAVDDLRHCLTLNRTSAVGLAEVDLGAEKCVEVPVGVAEVSVSTKLTYETALCASPKV